MTAAAPARIPVLDLPQIEADFGGLEQLALLSRDPIYSQSLRQGIEALIQAEILRISNLTLRFNFYCIGHSRDVQSSIPES